MIGVKEAVHVASQYLVSLFDTAPSDVQLEEVELSEDEKYWYITLSFRQGPLAAILPGKTYKLFKINADTGQMQSMKIREVA